MGLNNKIRRSQAFSTCPSRHKKRLPADPVSPCRAPSGRFADTSPSSSRLFQQMAHPHQMVGRQRPGEHPAPPGFSPEARLAHPPHGLQPAKDFFHPLAHSLTAGRARRPRGTCINRTAAAVGGVLRHVRYSRASRSVVDSCVSFQRGSPRKSTVGLPGSSGGGAVSPASFFWKLFQLAQASISVPSTVKCSSLCRSCARASFRTAWKKASATSPCSRRSRFLPYPVASQSGSSRFKPTNQRNKRL